MSDVTDDDIRTDVTSRPASQADDDATDPGDAVDADDDAADADDASDADDDASDGDTDATDA